MEEEEAPDFFTDFLSDDKTDAEAPQAED